MKVSLFGKNLSIIKKLVIDLGLELITTNPDLIISYGGDGTLLTSEREYPGVPKLPLRNSEVCNKCSVHDDETVLKKLVQGKLQLKEHKKLQTTLLYKNFYALNDFVVRNSDTVHTIRFKVRNEKLLIGDGIVVSTPFGSTGYFQSITRQIIKTGFGVAFNNTTEAVTPLFLKEGDLVNFNLVRGKATLSFDNSPEIFIIDEGSELNFKLSSQVAKIYEDTSLRCPNCQVNRDFHSKSAV